MNTAYSYCIADAGDIPAPAMLVGGLLPQQDYNTLKSSEIGRLSGFISSLCQLTLESLQAQNLKDFDGNPGDFGCQRQALNVYTLARRPALLEECQALQAEAQRVQTGIKSASQRKRPENAAQLRGRLSRLSEPSRDLRYLLMCRLLKAVRKTVEVEDNGIVVTKSDPVLLKEIYKPMRKQAGSYPAKIVYAVQVQVSILAMELLREQVQQLRSLDVQRKAFVAERLSLAESPLYTPNRRYAPKMFGCLYYDMLTVISRIREEQIIVCLKSVEKEGAQACGYLYQAREAGGPLEPIPAAIQLAPNQALIVLEGVVNCAREDLIARIQEIGLTELILREAAIAPPYNPQSTLEAVPDETARAEISACAERGRERLMKLDHIYASTLETENVRRIDL